MRKDILYNYIRLGYKETRVIKGASIIYVMEIFRPNTSFDTLFTVALCTRSHILSAMRIVNGDCRVMETDGLFVDRIYVNQAVVNGLKKELELESVRSQVHLWLECASAQHGRDKQVEGNVSVSKCLAGLGMVYSYGSMFYGRGFTL